MVKITIDNKIIEVESGTTIIEACEQVGIEIPKFCYHPRLKIAGNCRMCLVELEKNPKPVASCATFVSEGMVVHTNTKKVEKDRNSILELLLINHPLDCPICDQGGECDLQDLTMNYGADNSRYQFYKRAVTDKYMGPFIKTVMNRCIHCTRCVRFMDDIAGTSELRTNGRGEHMEIVSYLDQALTSELSGNIIDLCPVGALTNKPYAFHGRSWELTHTNSIDITDAAGSNIRLDSKGNKILRIMPRVNETINEEWISDKARFFYDGLSCQRLDQPYIRKNKKLVPCGWEDVLKVIVDKIKNCKPNEIAAISGDLADQEAQFALRVLLDKLHIFNRDCRTDGALIPYAHRSQYLFNTTIQGIENADVILLIGTNPRIEATILNARIRKAVLKGAIVGVIGQQAELTYTYQFLDEKPAILETLIKGKNCFGEILKNAKNPVIILGMSCFKRSDYYAILNNVNELHKKYHAAVNILHTAASCVGGLDAGFVPVENFGKNTTEIIQGCHDGSVKLVYLLNADIRDNLGEAFVIYHGHHGDVGADRADVILPSAAFSEKCATYVNMEGVSQRTMAALSPPGEAKEDWKIIYALATALKISLPFNTLEELQRMLPSFEKHDRFLPFETKPQKFLSEPFKPFITNYYMHDVISRYSKNMANAILEIVEKKRGII